MLSFSALSDPTRFRIVELLAHHGQLPVRDIGSEFTLSPPAISQHLKVLKEARLVKVEVSAQQRLYRLNPEGLKEIEAWTHGIRSAWQKRFDALEAMLAEEKQTQNQTKRRKP